MINKSKGEMQETILDYILESRHRIEDYSDLEILSFQDYDDAIAIINDKIEELTEEELIDFCLSIENNEVDYYMIHGYQ